MAVELRQVSPRISFSNDLPPSDTSPEGPHRMLDTTLLDPAQDFDFCIFRCEDDSASPADELFSDGKILPLQFKNISAPRPGFSDAAPPQRKSDSGCSPPPPQKKESLREILANSDSDDHFPIEEETLWGFKRSSSLDCSSNSKRGMICSLQLPSRSNSTGSTNPKWGRKPLKGSCRQLQKPHQNPNPSASGISQHRRTSEKKTRFGYHGNGIRISPVLNVVPPFISKGSGSFFGFRHFFCNGRDHRSKKKSTTSLPTSGSRSASENSPFRKFKV